MSERIKNIAAMAIFGSIGVFVRLIPMPSSVISLSRAVIGGVFLLILMLILGKRLSLSSIKENAILLLLSGIALGFNWMLLFEAYKYTSVANATLCYYLAPVIMVVLSPLIFKEGLTLTRVLAVILSVVGMALISGAEVASVGQRGVIGIILGISAACLYAMIVILNKKLCGISAYERTAVQLIVSAISMLPYCAFTGAFSGITLNALQIAIVLVLGIVHTGVAYALYFGSIGNLPAQTVALLGYIDPVLALVLSWTLLGEGFTLSGLVGAVLILGSMLFCEIWEGKKQKVPKK